jgi:uncharacterized RDD family membrane protein YckC
MKTWFPVAFPSLEVHFDKVPPARTLAWFLRHLAWYLPGALGLSRGGGTLGMAVFGTRTLSGFLYPGKSRFHCFGFIVSGERNKV